MGEGIMMANSVQEQLAQNGWFVIDTNQIQFSNCALVFIDASWLDASLLENDDCITLGLAPDYTLWPTAHDHKSTSMGPTQPAHQLLEPFECLIWVRC